MLCFLFSLTACHDRQVPEVVIYVSVDQVYAEPILLEFEANTGIHIRAIYDIEASKTTGLVNRLLAEKNHPLADVFWSGEFSQTILLKEAGILRPYASPQRETIPTGFKDIDGYWTGFGGRARILMVNTNDLTPDEYPTSIYSFLDSQYPAERIGLAFPLFGTTSTHAAAIYATLGTDAAQDYYQSLVERGVQVVDGNSVVRERVASGEWLFGMTDTDDACQAIQRGDPVQIIYPDQKAGELGALVIPNTVALIADSPHPVQGETFIDYLLSPEVEQALVKSGWIQFPLRPVDIRPTCAAGEKMKPMTVNFDHVYTQIFPSRQQLTEIFVH